uniref:Uncharacterized protein n=1 Tax=Molossus molossus TaxID=27622 RepID=A0A7J8JW53_MOLMO|nr:hypothetical protein HJG59_008058 [Molossus molossus]
MISRTGGRKGLACLTTASLSLCLASPPGLGMLSTLLLPRGTSPGYRRSLLPRDLDQVLVSDFLALLLLSERKILKFRPASSHKSSRQCSPSRLHRSPLSQAVSVHQEKPEHERTHGAGTQWSPRFTASPQALLSVCVVGVLASRT